jgi:deoxyribose-phosphate aldolase
MKIKTPEEILSSYKNLAKTIDHSLLQPELDERYIEDNCNLAIKYNTMSVMVRPSDVKFAYSIVKDSDVVVASSSGFPHGANLTSIKVAEAVAAIESGASEIDMVINIGLVKSGRFDLVEKDIAAVVDACDGRVTKVILENSYLTNEEKVLSCRAAENAGISFVKTASGYASGGATIEDVILMKKSVSDNIGVKAAGKVRTYDQLEEYVKHGVSRFGATATKIILDEYRAINNLEPIL